MSSSGTESSQQIFHLDIHAWLDSQQTSHGVRHDDYAQYHAYCTRRLSRLSHKPSGAKAYLVNSSKYASSNPSKPKTPGGRHAFCGRSHDTFALTKEVEVEADAAEPVNAAAAETKTTKVVQVPVSHENILWYLLVNAERSWAHANEIQKANQIKRRQPILKKLKRANKWAQLLVEKAKFSTDEETQKECEAYAAWMSANYALEQKQYQIASEGYARAMSLCHELSGENDTDNSANDRTNNVQRLERHDLFITRADTILRPLFRYCQYELKQAGQPTMEEPRLQSSGQEQEHEDEDSIVFRDRELILDNKDLRVLLLKLQSVEQEQKEEAEKGSSATLKETQFLTALSILDDAMEVVQLLEQGLSKASSSSGPAVQAKLQQYSLWRGYLQYSKTRKVMEHTENLLTTDSGESMGPAEKVHIYDAVLQHAKSLLNLPHPDDGNNSGGSANEEDEFILQVQANILRLRALKAYYMGWCYYTQLFKYGPALALLEHSAKLSERAEEEIAACDEDMPHADKYLQQLEDLPLESATGAVRAAMALQQRQHARKLQKAAGAAAANGSSPSCWQEPVTTDRPLLLRLYEYDGGAPDVPIADLRPMPLPCKPVFYDLVYGHAFDTAKSVDALEDFLYQHTAAPVSSVVDKEEKDLGNGGSSSGGMFGWLRG